MILYLDPYSKDGSVHIREKFLNTKYLHGTAEGLYNAFERALKHVGLEESKPKLIGFGCDGSGVNIAKGGFSY